MIVLTDKPPNLANVAAVNSIPGALRDIPVKFNYVVPFLRVRIGRGNLDVPRRIRSKCRVLHMLGSTRAVIDVPTARPISVKRSSGVRARQPASVCCLHIVRARVPELLSVDVSISFR